MSRYYINVKKVKAPFEPETLAFQSKVLSDDGKILDIDKLDNFIKANKAIGKYNALQFAVSKQFGYKLDGSGNIIKIYDASKNGNDLDISRGEVPEDLGSDMFFLNNVFFKDETVTFDVIGDKFTFVTDINHPNPDLNTVNYMVGFGDLTLFAGGTYQSGLLGIRTNSYIYRTTSGSFDNINDANVLRKLDYRYINNGNKIIRKDGVDMGNFGNPADEAFLKPDKIVYGGRTDETSTLDADCYLNDSFFYNDYLTDEELEIINEI